MTCCEGILTPMTFEDWDAGTAVMTDDYYEPVYGLIKGPWGMPKNEIIAYRGTTTGQLIAPWFEEVKE